MQLGHLRAKWCLPKFLSKLAFFTTSSMLFPLIRLTSTRAMRENKSNHLALSKRTDLLKHALSPHNVISSPSKTSTPTCSKSLTVNQVEARPEPCRSTKEYKIERVP